MTRRSETEATEAKLISTLEYAKEHGLTSEQIIELVGQFLKIPSREEVTIPLSIFNNDSLSSLESIVKYTRENLLLSFKQIASLTNRNRMTLAVSYRNAKLKLKAKFPDKISPYHFPVSILKNRALSVLENIVVYLKENFRLNYHSIAVLLNRDDRTIWTVYYRSKKKRSKKSKK